MSMNDAVVEVPAAELARARDSLALIAVRGYHRGRDLLSEMNMLVGTETA